MLNISLIFPGSFSASWNIANYTIPYCKYVGLLFGPVSNGYNQRSKKYSRYSNGGSSERRLAQEYVEGNCAISITFKC